MNNENWQDVLTDEERKFYRWLMCAGVLSTAEKKRFQNFIQRLAGEVQMANVDLGYAIDVIARQKVRIKELEALLSKDSREVIKENVALALKVGELSRELGKMEAENEKIKLQRALK